jgi:hypothetical protein
MGFRFRFQSPNSQTRSVAGAMPGTAVRETTLKRFVRTSMLTALVVGAAIAVPAEAMASTVKGVVVVQLSSNAVIVAKSSGALVRVRLAHRAHGNVVGRRVKLKGASNALGVFVSSKAKFAKKHVSRVYVRGVVVGTDAGLEVLADGSATIGVAIGRPSALGTVQLVNVSVGSRLTALGTRSLGGASSVRIAGVVSAIGGNGIALRLPGGINTGVVPAGIDFSTVPLGNDVLVDARVGGSGATTTFSAMRWALLTGKDRFANPKKREVMGPITAASGQHLTVRPLGLTATDFVLGPAISLGSIGRDDTVLVDGHVSGANLIADHVILLAKAVAAVKPTVTYLAAPPATTTARTATFDWSTDVPGSATICYLDNTDEPCSAPPYTATNLTPGDHIFRVAVMNDRGWSLPADVAWKITDPVTVQLTSTPTATTVATSATFGFTVVGEATDMMCSIDGAAYAACAATPGATSGTYTVTYTGLAVAPHIFGLYVKNLTDLAAITPYSWTVVLPVQAPVVTITQPASSTSTSAAVSFTATNTPTSITCALDGGGPTPCTSPYSVSNLAVGSHSVTVTASNSGGSDTKTTTWSVQPLAPVVTITSAPSGSTASTSASITWTATNSPTSTTCAIDGGAASACTSPKSYTGLAAGAHSVVVTATNVTGSGSGSAAWTIVAQPVVTITAQPSTSTSTSGAVSFTATNSPTTVTCSLDGGTATACTSPYSMTNLSIGSHTVTVSATNIAGTGSASTTAWTVQSPQVGAPVVTITSAPSGSTASTSASIAWTATNSPTSTTCAIDGGAASACTSPKSYTGLAAGAHSVVVAATNATGTGTATAAWTIVATPVVTITAQPSTSTSTSGAVSFTATNSPTTVTCALDSGTAAACTSPYSMTNLSIGSHTVTVSATNIAGTGSATTTAWTVQPAAPVVTITSSPSGSTTATTASIAWTATNSPTSVTCKLDSGTAAACTSPASLTGLGLGAHTYLITATNVTGSGTATAAWTVVAQAPTVTLTSTPVSTNAPSTATFQWTTGGGAPTSTMCSLDSAPSVACASGQSYSSLTAGSHTFAVTVSNSGGSATASYSWSVAQPVTPPTISLTQAPTPTTTATTATIGWTTTGTISSTTCTYDGTAYTPCTTPVNLSGVAVGSHSFVVTVTNTGGSASQTASWTVSQGAGSPPVNTALPTFNPSTWKPRSGKNGTTGAITNGTWSNSPTSYSYQWYRCLNSTSFASCQTGAGVGPSDGGVTNYPGPIAGATSSSYHAVQGDIDMYLRCVVTATNAGGSTDAVSAAAPKTQPS